jgi:C1A family cysteine protease
VKTEAKTVVSMTSQFPTPRNQGGRGTCVAFASVAFLEFQLAGGEARTKPLSEQFVYWACKEADELPTVSGTYLRVARKILATRGACRAATWEYETLPIGPTEGQGPPPPGAEQEAKQNQWKQARALTRSQIVDIDGLRNRLDAKEPIVFSVRTFRNWDFQVVQETGEIPMPLPGATPDGGHAIVLVGYEMNPTAPGGGAFIFRNSWGKDWSRLRGRHSGGYGTLFFDYVKDNALEAYG